MIISLYIINKAGGLIFQREFVKINTELRLTSNDYLRIAGVFHGMYAIASRLTPLDKTSSGIVEIDSPSFVLKCYQSVTGTKFFVMAEPGTNVDLNQYLLDVYQLYTDFTLKNPFYELEQPIHNNCDKFVFNLEKMTANMNGVRYEQ
eukprot:TRINITY_DN13428_c0_g1_i1.p1 TRINITY_DN13428_c0_g1~~TRINITY_DN13428_c0_g1_i1.p1  ORF type:complete len:147 (+),score=24.57 TRINITY_DN13428_c0_g1_i1:26-466(+)